MKIPLAMLCVLTTALLAATGVLISKISDMDTRLARVETTIQLKIVNTKP